MKTHFADMHHVMLTPIKQLRSTNGPRRAGHAGQCRGVWTRDRWRWAVGGWRRKGKKKQEAAGEMATEHVSTRKRLSVQGGRKGS